MKKQSHKITIYGGMDNFKFLNKKSSFSTAKKEGEGVHYIIYIK